jgi:hypothetical protein
MLIENCPSCGSKLEKGFISGARVAWSKRRKKFPELAGRFTQIECYSAHRCRKCNLVLFHNEPLPYHYRLLDPSVNMSYTKRTKQ